MVLLFRLTATPSNEDSGGLRAPTKFRMEIQDNIPFDPAEFGMDIPEVPDHYQELVARWGGNSGGVPNVRIVRGTDPTVVDWCGGEWIPRYSIPEVETITYSIWHKPDGTKKIITPAEAKVMESSNKIDGIILPVTETKVKDWLIPRYFVEVYKGPEYFGDPEIWNRERYIVDSQGKSVDLMGDFPENGVYETWFCIEDFKVNEHGKVEASSFRELDDEVMEVLREKIEMSKNKSTHEQAVESSNEWAKSEHDKETKFKNTIKEALSERIDRIVGTPKSTRIK